jgi:hypothetical protein
MSIADQIRAAVKPRIINRDYLLSLADEVARMEEKCAAFTSAWDDVQAAGARPAETA